MHGRLICHECRILLKEDEAHEKEQQAYEDRRHAKYADQLAGTNPQTNINTVEPTQEESTTDDNDSHEQQTSTVVRSPSPPRDLPQNYTRITLAEVFLLGLQDARVLKTTRQDGLVLTHRNQPIPLHLNRFACLHEIQDPPPVPRWTPRTLQFHIAYLGERQATRNKLSHTGTSHLTLQG